MRRLAAGLRRLAGLAGVLALMGWYVAVYPAVRVPFALVLGAGLALALAWIGIRSAGRRRARSTLGGLLSLSPAEFEAAVAGILRGAGYRRVLVVGGAGDLGADVAAVDRRGRRVIVQCKRNAPGVAVGSGAVQKLLGAVTHYGADRGLLVATSRFSAPACELAARHGLELIDGEALTSLAARRRFRPASAPTPDAGGRPRRERAAGRP